MARSPALMELASDIGGMIDPTIGRPCLHTLAARLRSFVEQPRCLPVEELHPGDHSYARHVLHADPAGRFAILGLVWRPGQATPAHDHRCWCVLSVHRGRLREEHYALTKRLPDGSVVATGSRALKIGETSRAEPESPFAHRIVNDGDETAISIHVYGVDAAVNASSNRQEFRVADDVVAPHRPGPTA